MTPHQIEKEKIKLRNRLSKALRSQDFVTINNIQRQLDALDREVVPVGNIMAELTHEKRMEIHKSFRKIPVFADLLEGTAIDTLALLKQIDSSIELPIMQSIDIIRAETAKLVKAIDSVGNYKISEEFGMMCDRLNLIVNNEFNFEDNKLQRAGK